MKIAIIFVPMALVISSCAVTHGNNSNAEAHNTVTVSPTINQPIGAQDAQQATTNTSAATGTQ